jgi:hypothetical protein
MHHVQCCSQLYQARTHKQVTLQVLSTCDRRQESVCCADRSEGQELKHVVEALRVWSKDYDPDVTFNLFHILKLRGDAARTHFAKELTELMTSIGVLFHSLLRVIKPRMASANVHGSPFGRSLLR